MSLLLIGGDSLIGSALVDGAASHAIPVFATSRRRGSGLLPLDLASFPEQWTPPEATRVAIICGAMTSIKDCELDPGLSSRVNVGSPVAIARAVQEAGGAVVFLSTNLVFGGKTDAPSWDAPLSPATLYGQQKAEAEAAILATGPRAAIVRLTKVVHPGMALFSGWVRALLQGQIVEPFEDMLFSPVALEEVTGCLLRLATDFEPGIFHLSGDQDISYAQAARWLAQEARVSELLVRPKECKKAGINFIPQYSRLQPRLPGESPSRTSDAETTMRVLFRRLLS